MIAQHGKIWSHIKVKLRQMAKKVRKKATPRKNIEVWLVKTAEKEVSVLTAYPKNKSFYDEPSSSF